MSRNAHARFRKPGDVDILTELIRVREQSIVRSLIRGKKCCRIACRYVIQELG